MIKRASDQIDLTKVVDGRDGTSVTILGSYNTMAELETAHPTGSSGDAYMVGGDLVIWNGTTWENVGRIQGPQGNPGTPGAPGTGVASVQPQYYLSTSDQSATGGTWGNTITFVSGLYIWSRDEITYSNGSVDHSAEVYNQALTIACENAISALAAAQAVNQYTWHTETDTGAGAGTHITMIPQDEFLADPANGGFNVLINSSGTYIRDGLTVLSFYGSYSLIGEINAARVEIRGGVINVYDNNGTLAFSVQTGTDSGDVRVQISPPIFSSIGTGKTVTYTLSETPLSGSGITVQFDNVTTHTFTAGTAKTEANNGVTVEYVPPATFNVTNNSIYTAENGYIVYTAHRTNAEVNIPATFNLQGIKLDEALLRPTLITQNDPNFGITPYQNRASINGGGYYDIGKWRYVNLQVDCEATSLGAKNTWALLQGFPAPSGYYAALACSRITSGATTGGAFPMHINNNGRLVVSTEDTPLTAGTQLVVTGWYLMA